MKVNTNNNKHLHMFISGRAQHILIKFHMMWPILNISEGIKFWAHFFPILPYFTPAPNYLFYWVSQQQLITQSKLVWHMKSSFSKTCISSSAETDRSIEKHTWYGPLVLSTFTVVKDLLVLALLLEKFHFVHAPCCQCCVRASQFSPIVKICFRKQASHTR